MIEHTKLAKFLNNSVLKQCISMVLLVTQASFLLTAKNQARIKTKTMKGINDKLKKMRKKVTQIIFRNTGIFQL